MVPNRDGQLQLPLVFPQIALRRIKSKLAPKPQSLLTDKSGIVESIANDIDLVSSKRQHSLGYRAVGPAARIVGFNGLPRCPTHSPHQSLTSGNEPVIGVQGRLKRRAVLVAIIQIQVNERHQ
jgi:hypothetical protein